jgi:hypothetical protein
MLDVHTPHSPAHGWREFLTNIVAIVIGLLLALALDKAVEFIHERHQLAQARRELAVELQDNVRQWRKNQAEIDRVQANLARDLELIRALRAHAVAVGRFDYSGSFSSTLDGAWQATRQNGALDLMPHEELMNYAWFNQLLGYVMDALHGFEPTMKIAEAIAASAAPDKISAHDLDELADRTMEAQGRLKNYEMFLGFEQSGFKRLGGDNVEMAQGGAR